MDWGRHPDINSWPLHIPGWKSILCVVLMCRLTCQGQKMWEYSLYLLLCDLRNRTLVIRLGSRWLTRRAISSAGKQELHTEYSCLCDSQSRPVWWIRVACLRLGEKPVFVNSALKAADTRSWHFQTGEMAQQLWALSQRTQDQSPTPSYRVPSSGFLRYCTHTMPIT